MRRLGVAMPSGAAFGIALRGPWKLGAWFLGGAQGRGVRDPHPGVASTTPAVGSATSAARQNAGTDRASWSRRWVARYVEVPVAMKASANRQQEMGLTPWP